MSDDDANMDERLGDAWLRVIAATSTLGVHAGIMTAAASPWPLFAKENFEEKLSGIADWADQMTEEIHGFGEAYDGKDTNES